MLVRFITGHRSGTNMQRRLLCAESCTVHIKQGSYNYIGLCTANIAKTASRLYDSQILYADHPVCGCKDLHGGC